jgi:hypothetical protein
MVHLAMHDAFFGIPGTIPTVANLPPGLTKNFQTYLPINTTLQAGLTPAAHVGPAVTAAA